MADRKQLAATAQLAGVAKLMMHTVRLQAAIEARAVARRELAELFAAIIESKDYLGLPYIDADGSQRHVADFDEYCMVFYGQSGWLARELIANFDMLGADLYEAAERIGLCRDDYDDLRALPADALAVVKAALAEGQDPFEVLHQLEEARSSNPN